MAEPQFRQKIPKDGPGPRGVPDCYYTSRVLNSTFRYVKFVRKLRALEEEERRGAENKLKQLKDIQINDFFIRCDRRQLIKSCARRVDLCMAAYQEDLKQKQQRLIDLYAKEEEENTRKFVIQAQAGAQAVWQDKVDRLDYLIAKRKKEHEERFKDTPLSKSAHVLPCILKIRAKETQDIQLYQMREKQARQLAEKEFDKMWHAVAMKESDALAARMEQDEIELYRKNQESKRCSDYEIEQKRIRREKEKEILKEEARRFKASCEAALRKEAEAEMARAEKRMKTAEERKKMLEETHVKLARQAEADKVVADAWDSLACQGRADELAKIELRKRKERELDLCNMKLIELKKQYEEIDKMVDAATEEEAAKAQEKIDRIRCNYIGWAKKTNRDVRQAMVGQIKDREQARVALKHKIDEENEHYRQVAEQLQKLVKHKQLTDAQARKMHQRDLIGQIEYNQLLKERARQDELDEIKKCQMAAQEYEDDIKKMLCRPFFSDVVHPFMRQMARGLEMPEKCPCSRPDYCK